METAPQQLGLLFCVAEPALAPSLGPSSEMTIIINALLGTTHARRSVSGGLLRQTTPRRFSCEPRADKTLSLQAQAVEMRSPLD
jgi:hypothetical protein